jgi:hypothetical protein
LHGYISGEFLLAAVEAEGAVYHKVVVSVDGPQVSPLGELEFGGFEAEPHYDLIHLI